MPDPTTPTEIPQRVRDLVQEAWAGWTRPLPAALVRTRPEVVLAELDRRRAKARRWLEAELDAIQTLEARYLDAREDRPR